MDQDQEDGGSNSETDPGATGDVDDATNDQVDTDMGGEESDQIVSTNDNADADGPLDEDVDADLDESESNDAQSDDALVDDANNEIELDEPV